MQYIRIKVRRFAKGRNVVALSLHIALLFTEEIVVDKILNLAQENPKVDSFLEAAPLLIVVSLALFSLWVFFHKDNETTVRQIYITLKDLKEEERAVADEALPALIRRQRTVAAENAWLAIQKDKMKELEDFDWERAALGQIGHLLTGNTELPLKKRANRTIRALRHRLYLLQSDLLDRRVEELLGKHEALRQGIENVTVGYRGERECFQMDIDYIRQMSALTRQGEANLRVLELELVGVLSQYAPAGKPVTVGGVAHEYKGHNV